MAGKKKRFSSRGSRMAKLVRGVTSRDPDDGLRGAAGVVASLVKRADDSVRLVFDDVHREDGGEWTPIGLFTSRDYTTVPLRALRVEPADLAKIGWLVVARLLALDRTRADRG